jgi:hypothetical protein
MVKSSPIKGITITGIRLSGGVWAFPQGARDKKKHRNNGEPQWFLMISSISFYYPFFEMV